jgi:hypothetical protein
MQESLIHKYTIEFVHRPNRFHEFRLCVAYILEETSDSNLKFLLGYLLLKRNPPRDLLTHSLFNFRNQCEEETKPKVDFVIDYLVLSIISVRSAKSYLFEIKRRFPLMSKYCRKLISFLDSEVGEQYPFFEMSSLLLFITSMHDQFEIERSNSFFNFINSLCFSEYN